MSYSVLSVVSFASELNGIVSAVNSSTKMIGLVKDLGSKCCSFLFYRGVATAYSCGTTERSKNLYKDYSIRSIAETGKIPDALVRILTYLFWGKDIVAFSSNPGERFHDLEAELRFRKIPFAAKTNTPVPMEILEKTYGVDTMAKWCKDVGVSSTAQIVGFSKEIGCCFGMVCEFIALYMRNRALGKSEEDAIKSIAHKFASGASEQAQIAQFFLQSFWFAIENSSLHQELLAKEKGVDVYDQREKKHMERIQKLQGSVASSTSFAMASLDPKTENAFSEMNVGWRLIVLRRIFMMKSIAYERLIELNLSHLIG